MAMKKLEESRSKESVAHALHKPEAPPLAVVRDSRQIDPAKSFVS
jgi:hypothetical protein